MMNILWTSLLGVFALVASALAAAPMDVTYLHMGIQIGSVMDNDYIFQVKSADFAKTECRAHRVSPDGRLVSIGRTACDDGSVSFQLTFRPNMGDGGSMEIWHTGRGVAHYGHFAFNGEWFQWVSAQNVGSQENYYGPSNFTITNVSDRPL